MEPGHPTLGPQSLSHLTPREAPWPPFLIFFNPRIKLQLPRPLKPPSWQRLVENSHYLGSLLLPGNTGRPHVPVTPPLAVGEDHETPCVLGEPLCPPASLDPAGEARAGALLPKCLLQDFPGGPVIKTLLPRQGAPGSISELGTRSCLLQRRSSGLRQRPSAAENNNIETPKFLVPWISAWKVGCLPAHGWTVALTEVSRAPPGPRRLNV